MNESHQPSPRAWLVVALLAVVACLNYLDRTMITTMRGSLVAAIPMTEAQFGLLTSVFLWVYGILSPFAGFLSDRFSRSRVIICSLIVWSIVTWLTAHARSFQELIITRALMGISEACYIPAALALIADYHRGPTRSFATGLHMTGVIIGAGLGGLGGLLAERHTWNYAFALFGVIGVGYSVLLIALLRDAPRETASEAAVSPAGKSFGAAVKNLFGRSAYIMALAYWGLLGLAGWMVVGWMPTYLNEHFHLTQGMAGLSATGYLQSAALVGVIFGGMWADVWSLTNSRARILVPALGLCVAAPGILLSATTDVTMLAIAGLCIYGLTRAFTDANMMPILCMVSDPRYRATGYGILNLFSCIVGGLTIYAGGLMRDAQVDLGHIFQFAALSLLLCAILLFFVKPSPAPIPGVANLQVE